jgi:hypothetical protein
MSNIGPLGAIELEVALRMFAGELDVCYASIIPGQCDWLNALTLRTVACLLQRYGLSGGWEF